jgi:hypothetical protein
MEVWVSAYSRSILSFTVNVVYSGFQECKTLCHLFEFFSNISYTSCVLRPVQSCERHQNRPWCGCEPVVRQSKASRDVAVHLSLSFSASGSRWNRWRGCGVARLRRKARRRPNSRPPNFNDRRQLKSLWCACVAYSVAEADIHFSLRADSSGTYFKAIQDTRLAKLPHQCAPLFTHPVVAMACSSMCVRCLTSTYPITETMPASHKEQRRNHKDAIDSLAPNPQSSPRNLLPRIDIKKLPRHTLPRSRANHLHNLLRTLPARSLRQIDTRASRRRDPHVRQDEPKAKHQHAVFQGSLRSARLTLDESQTR